MSDQIAVVSVVIFNVSKQLNSWGLFCWAWQRHCSQCCFNHQIWWQTAAIGN